MASPEAVSAGRASEDWRWQIAPIRTALGTCAAGRWSRRRTDGEVDLLTQIPP
jgi:hypothetical protein